VSSKTFTLDELCTLAGCPRRTVRYYIQKGLLARPEGEKRGSHYLPSHLDSLLRIKRLTEAGISLERIHEVLAGEPAAVPLRLPAFGSVEVKSHIRIAPGIEIQVSPEQATVTPEQLRSLAKAVLSAWDQIKKDSNEE
jgi:DNA-binding transcriptional MerR regulator